MHSRVLGKYLTLRSFWQNLGLTYKDIQELPYYTSEMLVEIMNYEEQYQGREIKKQTLKKHG